MQRLRVELRKRLRQRQTECQSLLTHEFRETDQGSYICRIIDLLDVERLGFTRQRVDPNSMSNAIWINEEEKLVIKLPYNASPEKPRPKTAVPTVKINVRGLTRQCERSHIVIQPLVDTQHQTKAHAELTRRYKPWHRDLKKENTGHWKGNAVLIDW